MECLIRNEKSGWYYVGHGLVGAMFDRDEKKGILYDSKKEAQSALNYAYFGPSSLKCEIVKAKDAKRERWYIAVGSWGVIVARVTELKAESLRCHKAKWEHSPAVKIRAIAFNKLTDEEVNHHWAYKMIRDHKDPR